MGMICHARLPALPVPLWKKWFSRISPQTPLWMPPAHHPDWRKDRDVYPAFAFETFDGFPSETGGARCYRLCASHVPLTLRFPQLSLPPTSQGGDVPEDIAGGLSRAVDLSWKSPIRLCILIADAPCHGSIYHACRDNYPGGCPKKLDPRKLLCTLQVGVVYIYHSSMEIGVES